MRSGRGLSIGLAVAAVLCGTSCSDTPPAKVTHPTPSVSVKEGGAGATAPVEQAHGRVVYLTFDDGPDPLWTPKVLAVLAKHAVHATFFMLAQHANPHQELVDEVRAAGHAIGNHSVSHPKLTKLSPAQLHHQVADGVHSRCFRPPYGATNPKVRAEIKRDGMQQVLWDVDTRDWSRPGVPVIVKRALAGARPGAIILMHDGGGNRSETVAALGQILTALSARGYHFATLSC
ncbi:polysaccharide deacetylase family protein [Kribbella sp.]|uniref:polysaccharide deacetylase family protein n=1 Tax=Kribbella sp. TaxID=1871183 RepID=UPI002D35B508|nr:polysaccharide deacetylase family protein [Kribbella sp.]HZX02799.1 polysaccharide deacetylase family protein [Kribbella sp.]